MRGNGIVVLGHDTCVLDVEVAVELAVAFFTRLLVPVDLIAEDEAKRALVVTPGVHLRRLHRSGGRQSERRAKQKQRGLAHDGFLQ